MTKLSKEEIEAMVHDYGKAGEDARVVELALETLASRDWAAQDAKRDAEFEVFSRMSSDRESREQTAAVLLAALIQLGRSVTPGSGHSSIGREHTVAEAVALTDALRKKLAGGE